MFRSLLAFGTGIYVGQEYGTIPRVKTIVNNILKDVESKLKEYENTSSSNINFVDKKDNKK